MTDMRAFPSSTNPATAPVVRVRGSPTVGESRIVDRSGPGDTLSVEIDGIPSISAESVLSRPRAPRRGQRFDGVTRGWKGDTSGSASHRPTPPARAGDTPPRGSPTRQAMAALLVAILAEVLIWPRGLGGGLNESAQALDPARMWVSALTWARGRRNRSTHYLGIWKQTRSPAPGPRSAQGWSNFKHRQRGGGELLVHLLCLRRAPITGEFPCGPGDSRNMADE